MASNIDRFSNFKHLLSNYHKKDLESEISGRCNTRNESGNNHSSISERLQNLPKIKASKQFDQKMVAAFAMELQKEEKQRNKSWLEKHPKISLPDIVMDLTKNFL